MNVYNIIITNKNFRGVNMKKLVLILLLTLGSISMADGMSEENTGARFNVLFWTIGGTFDGEVEMGEDKKTRDYHGLDLNLFSLSKSKDFTGYQFSIIGMNKVHGNFKGIGQGLINYHKKNTEGAQIDAINISKNVKGAQWGLINTTKKLNGFQIGLLNFAPNGFLPVFPFFNISKEIVN